MGLPPAAEIFAGGVSDATMRPASLVSGGTTLCGPSVCGPVASRREDTQTEAPAVAKAGTRGPNRSTVRFIS